MSLLLLALAVACSQAITPKAKTTAKESEDRSEPAPPLPPEHLAPLLAGNPADALVGLGCDAGASVTAIGSDPRAPGILGVHARHVRYHTPVRTFVAGSAAPVMVREGMQFDVAFDTELQVGGESTALHIGDLVVRPYMQLSPRCYRYLLHDLSALPASGDSYGVSWGASHPARESGFGFRGVATLSEPTAPPTLL